MGIRFAQKLDFAVGHDEAFGQEAFDGHVTIVVLALVHEGTFAAFAQNMIGREADLANLKHIHQSRSITINHVDAEGHGQSERQGLGFVHSC